MIRRPTPRARNAVLTALPTRPWPTSTTWLPCCASAAGEPGAVALRRRQRRVVVGNQAIEQREQQRIEHDRNDGAGQHQVAAALRQQLERDAEADQDEGELADLRQAAEIVSAVRVGWPNSRTMANAASDLPITMISTVTKQRQRIADR